MARAAPVKLAKTSKTSACLLVVNSSWSISMQIPKTNENRIEIAKGFKLFITLNCFFKNKNQSNVNTK